MGDVIIYTCFGLGVLGIIWYISVRPQVQTKLPLIKVSNTRSEYIDFIVNKTLDTYENALLKNLEASSDAELKRTVLLIKEAETYLLESKKNV